MASITYRTERLLEQMGDAPGTHIHLLCTSTKPDIVKQVPLQVELQKRGHTPFLLHISLPDEDVSMDMLGEAGVEPDALITVTGTSHQVLSQMTAQVGDVIHSLTAKGKTVVPYVHANTMAALAVSSACYSLGLATVHVEAGIRTLTPKYRESGRWDTEERFDVSQWYNFLQDLEHWERGSMEPVPEQFHARTADAAAGLHLAPHMLNQELLLAEGFATDRVITTGNTMTDTLQVMLEHHATSNAVTKHPLCAQGNFAWFSIHRRENCLAKHRFRAIYAAMVDLVRAGRTVLLVALPQTDAALRECGLQEEVQQLSQSYPNFVYEPEWPRYTDVIGALRRASVCVTDSGTMQEEMNILGVPCVTVRFGTDRTESVLNGGNIIAPPVSSGLIARMVDFAWDNEYMRRRPKIYGQDVATACVDAVVKTLEEGHLLRTEEARLRL